MNFNDMQRMVLTPIGRTPTTADSDTLKFAKDAINNVINEIATNIRFHFLSSNYRFVTNAPYSTGTVAVTNGSATVTGTGTVFTRDFDGRQFSVAGSHDEYTVTFVTSTSLTLDHPYIGTTAAAATYEITSSEYWLPANFDKILSVKARVSDSMLRELSHVDFDEMDPRVTNQGQPELFALHGNEEIVYSTGTVTVTNASATVAGSGTAWGVGENRPETFIGAHFNVVGKSEDYLVRSVASNTSLTLDRVYESVTAAGASYRIYAFNEQIHIYPIPDAAYFLDVKYYRCPTKLSNDSDIPEFPDKYLYAAILGAQARLLLYKQHPNAGTYRDLFEKAIASIKADNTGSASIVHQMKRYDSTVAEERIRVNWDTLG